VHGGHFYCTWLHGRTVDYLVTHSSGGIARSMRPVPINEGIGRLLAQVIVRNRLITNWINAKATGRESVAFGAFCPNFSP
jgi:hypothetical protein